jgi:Fe-Mn family superoxide dismutase
MEFEATFKRQLKPKPMPGLSQRQINDHFDVKYKGYVAKFNEIQKKLGTIGKETPNPNYSEVRELLVERLYCHDSIKLHEAYFQCLGGAGDPPQKLLQMIEEDFGGFNAWKEEFKACALTARGWAVLGFDLDSGRLFNSATDFHSIAPWNVVGLMVLDVYEHAYYIDYGASVKSYVEEGFLKNMSWRHSEKAIERHHITQHRQEAIKKAA